MELRYLPSDANESSVCDRILAFMHKHDPALDIDEAGIKNKNILCILNVLDFIYKVSELNYGS